MIWSFFTPFDHSLLLTSSSDCKNGRLPEEVLTEMVKARTRLFEVRAKDSGTVLSSRKSPAQKAGSCGHALGQEGQKRLGLDIRPRYQSDEWKFENIHDVVGVIVKATHQLCLQRPPSGGDGHVLGSNPACRRVSQEDMTSAGVTAPGHHGAIHEERMPLKCL